MRDQRNPDSSGLKHNRSNHKNSKMGKITISKNYLLQWLCRIPGAAKQSFVDCLSHCDFPTLPVPKTQGEVRRDPSKAKYLLLNRSHQCMVFPLFCVCYNPNILDFPPFSVLEPLDLRIIDSWSPSVSSRPFLILLPLPLCVHGVQLVDWDAKWGCGKNV